MSKRQVPTSGNASLDASHPFLPLEETMRSNAADIESTLDEIPKNYGYGYDNDYDYDYDYDYDSTTSKKNDDGPAKLKVSSRRNNSGSSSEIDPTIESSEKNNNNNNDDNDKSHAAFALAVNSLSLSLSRPVSFCQKRKLPDGKKIAWGVVGCFFVFILWECFFVEPQDRLIQPDFSDKFLTWVQSHPTLGLGAILIVIAAAVVSLVPIGTPLTLGCGYIYRGVYGWKMGLFVSTLVSMAGSTLGAVTCFLLGRYLMRDTVKRWVRNYPMFDAIDVGEWMMLCFCVFVFSVCVSVCVFCCVWKKRTQSVNLICRTKRALLLPFRSAPFRSATQPFPSRASKSWPCSI